MSGNGGRLQFDTDHESLSRTSIPMDPAATERHPKFYFDDTLVVIQIESTLFRVHKYQLIKSETFSDMFGIPKGQAGELEEGSSPERPIVLSGVKSSDFEALLTVLYTVHFTNEKPKCEPEIIVPAFRLAHMWNFSDLRSHLLPLVKDSLGCVDKIVLARELGMQEWLAPAHVELCQRAESLTMEEVKKLGVNSAVMIFRLREQYPPSQVVANSRRRGDFCGGCAGVTYYNGSYSTNCQQCGNSTWSFYRYTSNTSGTTPPSDDGLDNKVKKWVEAGCETE